MKLFQSQVRLKFALLVGIVFLALFLNLYKKDVSPPGFNADEAAFGYNAYSLLKTGADEYGHKLPLRLESFGDYKLPLYSYLSVPFVATFGLTEDSTRMLNTVLAVLLPLVIFFLAKELFDDDYVGLLSSFLVSTSLGLAIVGRHAHEAYLFFFFAALTLFFLIRTLKHYSNTGALLTGLFLLLSLFSYQSARVFAAFVFIFSFLYVLKFKAQKKILIIVVLAVLLFGVTDLIYKPTRVSNLLLFNNPGFSMQVFELRTEGGLRLFYNKAAIALRDITFQHTSYYSPDFLVLTGDKNFRFGYPKMSPVNLVEYVFIFLGIYFLFKNKNKWKWLLLSLALVAPLSGSLSWAEASLTRSLLLLLPLLLIASYGIMSLIYDVKKYKKILVMLIALSWAFFSFYSWDFYLNHYPKRAVVAGYWQAGYRQLEDYIAKNYDKFDKFYVTKKNGQPYIFNLFYLKYQPVKYQKEASLSKADQYGFGQVEGFDKFDFNFKNPTSVEPKSSIIGYPDDFSGVGLDNAKIKKIVVGQQEVFWIYEKP